MAGLPNTHYHSRRRPRTCTSSPLSSPPPLCPFWRGQFDFGCGKTHLLSFSSWSVVLSPSWSSWTSIAQVKESCRQNGLVVLSDEGFDWRVNWNHAFTYLVVFALLLVLSFARSTEPISKQMRWYHRFKRLLTYGCLDSSGRSSIFKSPQNIADQIAFLLAHKAWWDCRNFGTRHLAHITCMCVHI